VIEAILAVDEPVAKPAAAIETRNLTKRYGTLTAVNDLSFRIEPGQLYGFIGPNGAGKTTTIRMLAGLLPPTSGQILIQGEDISDDPQRARWLVGYMPDFFGVYEDMKVWEYLDFFARCYQMPPDRRATTIDDLLHLVDLSSRREAFVESLSRGMRQRLCLAHALVHDPAILLLDEPASGLDPRARIEMRELLRELGRMGKTVLISSHILAELAEMCDAVAIIERGKLLASGSVGDIARMARADRMLLVELLAWSAGADVDRAVEVLRAYEGVQDVIVTEKGLEVPFSGDDASASGLLRHLIEQGVAVLSFGEATSDLEEIFLSVTKGEVQ
jgi:ABC-2 type transport system ATP-binding protein